MRTYIGKVIFSRGLKNLGAQIIYSLLLALLLISNFTGVSQAKAAQEDPLVNSQVRPNDSDLENTLQALKFTDPEERLSSKPLSQVATPSPLLNGLVAYWNMDETSGSTVADSTGSNNGIATGTTITNGKIGNARNFNGSGDYITESNGLPVRTSSVSFTVSGWVNTTTSNNGPIWQWGDSATPSASSASEGPVGWRYTNGRIAAGFYSIFSGHHHAEASSSVTDNNWHHIVQVGDGATGKLYINGILISSTTAGYTYASNPFLLIGARAKNSGSDLDNIEFYSGLIDEVGVWNRALTGSEVAELYRNGDGLSYPFVNASIEVASYTSSLLHFDGVDASTLFTDETGKLWTAVGDAQLDTSQFKFGGASAKFDGSGDYLTTPDHADFDFGGGDFTIDAWVKFNTVGFMDRLVGEGRGASAVGSLYTGWSILLQNSGQLELYRYDGSETKVGVPWTPSTATWYHVAVVRNGNEALFFVDGIQQGTTQDVTGNVYDGLESTGLQVGLLRIGNGSTYEYFDGWIEELSISKGIARWMSDFTPPEAPYGTGTPPSTDGLVSWWSLDETSGTRVDSHGSNDLSDNNTVTQAVGKIGNAGQFISSNSEYLSLDDNPDVSTGDIDFTFVGWAYLNDKDSYRSVLGKDHQHSNNMEYSVLYNLSDRWSFNVSPDGTNTNRVVLNADNIGSPSINTWYFIVAWHDSVANTLNIQVNDGPVDSVAHSGGVYNGTEAFRIGARHPGSGPLYMNGRIDEVAFFKRVLTAGERTWLYNDGQGRSYVELTSASTPPIEAAELTCGSFSGITCTQVDKNTIKLSNMNNASRWPNGQVIIDRSTPLYIEVDGSGRHVNNVNYTCGRWSPPFYGELRFRFGDLIASPYITNAFQAGCPGTCYTATYFTYDQSGYGEYITNYTKGAENLIVDWKSSPYCSITYSDYYHDQLSVIISSTNSPHPDPEISTIDISPPQVIADGNDYATVTVILFDVDGNPIPNKPVEIAIDSGPNLSINDQAVGLNEFVLIGNTDANGEVTANLSSTKVGTRTINARGEHVEILQQGTVNFIAGSVSASKSKLETNLTTLYDDGVTPATVTVSAIDSFNNPVSGATVGLFTTGNAVVTPINNVTDDQGKSIFQITDATPETVMVSAEVDGLPLDSNVQIRFHCRIDGNLTIVNGDSCSLSADEYTFDNIVIESNARLYLYGDTSLNQGVTLNATNLTVEAGGVISADGRGYGPESGPGKGGRASNSVGGGGGHGGQGGISSRGVAGGGAYGDLYMPVTLGSGGGKGGRYVRSVGGAGGGAIRLDVSETLILNGTVTANGNNSGSIYFGAGGGGAGGSIWITANAITGNGTIRANGGVGRYEPVGSMTSGGGAGGRIAIDVPSAGDSYSGSITAFGNYGNQYGGAGTIYWHATDRLKMDNNSRSGARTPLPVGNHHFDHIDIKGRAILRIVGASSSLTVENGVLDGSDGSGRLEVEGTLNGPTDFVISRVTISILKEMVGPVDLTLQTSAALELYANRPAYPGGVYTFRTLTIKSNTALVLFSHDGPDQDDYGVTLQVDNLTVEAGGVISADGRGYGPETGPGKGGRASNSVAGGGGHGGKGGNSSRGVAGGGAYGDLYMPVTLGSGGGKGGRYVRSVGGAGGGAIRLDVSETLILNGTVTANGNNSGSIYYGAGGGGAGGSIWITANAIAGNGTIRANGGFGRYEPVGRMRSGGGAGGRIAIESNDLADSIRISVAGGSGHQYGGVGTIYLDNIDPGLSTVEIAPSHVTANGSNFAIVAVSLLNQAGTPIPNKPIEIAIASGPNLNINDQAAGPNQFIVIGTTNTNGVVTALLKTTKAGIRTIKARSGLEVITAHGTVEFVPGEPSASNSSLSASPNKVPADGQTPISVTVTLKDAHNNSIQNAEVTLQVTGAAVVTQPTLQTNSQGRTTGSIVSTESGVFTISASAAGVALDDQVDIIFGGPDLSLWLTTSTEIPAGVVVPFTSTATINNLDLLDAQNTTLQITLPDGISYLSDDSDVTPTQAGGTLTWDLGTLSAGESTSLTLQAKSNLSLTVGSSLTTTAVVSTSDVEDDLENNSASADTPVVSGYSSSGSIDPANQTLAIGGSGTFDLTIHNTGLLSDQYGIAVLGLEAELYSLSQTELALAPQENVAIALNTTANSCEQAGTHAFTAVVTSQSSGASFTLPGSVEFLSAPIISNLRPANGTIYGSRDVSISWQTDVASNGSLTVTPEGQPENAQTFETSSGNSHTVLVTDLDRNSTYSWVVTATSPCGETTSNPKQFSIGNGVVFKDHQTNLTIDRDYDQTAQIMVTNQDNKPHDILVEIQHSYEDLIVNFRGSGSIDETITLLPGESRTIELAVFAQDAELIDENYVLNAVLTSSDGLQTITDLAIINVRVLFEVNYSLDEISSNSLYNTTTYRITNYGQPITDLFVNVVDPTTNLPASVMITPQVVHARLGTDESLEFTATPLYSVEDLTDTTGNSSTIGVLASLAKQSGAIDINFAFDITVANVVQRHEVQQSCDLGRSIYAVTLSNVLLHLPFKSWYCPNRANIHMGICVPPIAQASNITGASININIDPTRKPSKYDFSIRVNGNQVGSLKNQIPEGQYRFPIDKSFINTAFSGCASNDIHINARFDNYAHYQIWADGELSLALDSVTVFVCAIDQAQADQIAFGLYNFEKLPDTFSVDIRLPNANSTAESNSDGYVKLQAFVSDNLTSFKDYYTVEAEIEYLDAIGTPTEKFLLFNDGLAVHADPTAKDRSFNTLWLPKYGGDIHMTVYATGPAGRVVTDEITFNIDARPDFELTRVFIEKITRKG